MRCAHPLRQLGCVAVGLGLGCGSVCAQFSLTNVLSVRSASGQFLAVAPSAGLTASPLANRPAVATNADFVRLEPALLAISAERIKESLWQALGIRGPWRGKIFLVLHPARSLDEDVTIVSARLPHGWDYRVFLPDVLSRSHYVRAMVGVLLLAQANRQAGGRSAEVPAWLTDGLTRQVLASGLSDDVLSTPSRLVNGLALARTVARQHGLDALVATRQVLQAHPALTFAQLSWPTDAQLAGDDQGVYRASAQLFVNRLLELPHGPARLRTMIGTLARCYNWQTAFFAAFQVDFSRTLDVEKWWALQVVNFVAHAPGPTWTPAVSRAKLGQLLRVPVEVRLDTNDLPAHSWMTLQAVIRDWDYARQAPVLRTRVRDLALAQLRMAPAYAVLTAEYHRVLDRYLAGRNGIPPRPTTWNKHPRLPILKILRRDTLKRLDALDARWRATAVGRRGPRSRTNTRTNATLSDISR